MPYPSVSEFSPMPNYRHSIWQLQFVRVNSCMFRADIEYMHRILQVLGHCLTIFWTAIVCIIIEVDDEYE